MGMSLPETKKKKNEIISLLIERKKQILMRHYVFLALTVLHFNTILRKTDQRRIKNGGKM